MSTGIGTVSLMQSLIGKEIMDKVNNHEAFFLGSLERDIQNHKGSKQITFSQGNLETNTASTLTVIFKDGQFTETANIGKEKLIQNCLLVIISTM